MEIVIVICLLIVIVLLLQDKIVIHKRSKQRTSQQKVNPNLPDIMGKPKPVERLSVPNTATERQIQEPEINPANLDIEYDENENVNIQIPGKENGQKFSERYLIWKKRKKNGTGTEYPVVMTVLPKGLPLKN